MAGPVYGDHTLFPYLLMDIQQKPPVDRKQEGHKGGRVTALSGALSSRLGPSGRPAFLAPPPTDQTITLENVRGIMVCSSW